MLEPDPNSGSGIIDAFRKIHGRAPRTEEEFREFARGRRWRDEPSNSTEDEDHNT